MRHFAVLAAVMLLATPLFAASGSQLVDWYIIPAAAHTEGAQGTFWRTDVSIANPYSWRNILVLMKYLPADQDNTDAVLEDFTLAAGAELLLEDVVSTVFETTGVGALLVYSEGNAVFTVSARTYTGSDATYGQTENGQGAPQTGPGTAFVTGIIENDRYRSNIGAANASDVALAIRARVYGATGTQCGNENLTIPPWSQTQISVASICDGVESGYVRWDAASSAPNLRWVAYASVVDNASGDAVFLEERIDQSFTQFHTLWDISGWWTGTITGPGLFFNGSVLFEQDSAAITAWIYNEEGFLHSTFEAYESLGDIVIEGGSLLYLPCFDNIISTGSATPSLNSVEGEFRASGSCLTGTVSFSLSPQ
jgi:hypothetical protein